MKSERKQILIKTSTQTYNREFPCGLLLNH